MIMITISVTTSLIITLLDQIHLKNWTLLKFAMNYEPIYASKYVNLDHDEEDDDAFEDQNSAIADDNNATGPSRITLKDAKKTKMKIRTREAIVVTPSFSISKDAESYFYHLLLLHKHFRQEDELLNGYESCAAAFEGHKHELQESLNNLQPMRRLFQELETAIDHIQNFDVPDNECLPIQDFDIQLPDCDQIPQMTEPQFQANQQALNVDQRRLFNYIKRQILREVTGVQCQPIRLFVTGKLFFFYYIFDNNKNLLILQVARELENHSH